MQHNPTKKKNGSISVLLDLAEYEQRFVKFGTLLFIVAFESLKWKSMQKKCLPGSLLKRDVVCLCSNQENSYTSSHLSKLCFKTSLVRSKIYKAKNGTTEICRLLITALWWHANSFCVI